MQINRMVANPFKILRNRLYAEIKEVVNRIDI